MQNAKNLVVAEYAHRLAIATYRHTALFPVSERFGLTSQMRRAAVSIASNIAEGCGRRSNRELLPYLHIASGSARELACQLKISTQLGLGEASSAGQLDGEVRRVLRMPNRLIIYHRSQPAARQKADSP
jgi:four helix bundle protein